MPAYTLGAEFTVNTRTGLNQEGPQIITLSDGRVLATWTTGDAGADGSSAAIAGRIGTVQADGSVVWGAEFRVNAQVSGGQHEPQVVQLGDGRVLFTWFSNDEDVDGEDSGISGRIGTVQSDGSIIWDSFGEFTVNEEILSDQETPQVTVLADGRVMFAWTSFDPDVDGSGGGIAARIGTVQANGSIVWDAAGEITVNEEVTNGQFDVQITVLADGRVLATWWSQDADVDGSTTGISARIGTVQADGSISWGAAGEITVNEELQSDQNQAQVTILPDGRVLFTWSSNDPDVDGSFSGISARVGTVQANGSISWAAAGEVSVNQETEGGQYHPQVTVLSDGRLLFTWTTYDTTIDANAPGISARIGTMQADGSIVWSAEGEIRINANGLGAQEYPQVTELADGRVVITWQSASAGGDASGTGIAGRTLQFNQAPIAADDALSVAENGAITGGNVFANNGAGADNAVDGDPLAISAVNGSGANVGVQITLASGALLTVNANGTFDYNPNGQYEHLGVGESATDSFNYTIADGFGGSDTATVNITINGANDQPIAQDDAVTAGENTPSTGSLLADNGAGADADIDGDALSVTAVNGVGGNVGVEIALSSGALLTVNADGTYTYNANGAFEALAVGESDSDTFTYTVSDDQGGTDTATVTVTINGANDAPAAQDDGFAISEAGSIVGGNLFADNGSGADGDIDGDALAISAVNSLGGAVGIQIALASGALLTVNANGTFDHDPNGAFEDLGVGESDTDTFTYTVSDGNGGTDTASVSVTINGANDAPEAENDAAAVTEDGAISGRNLLSDNGAGADSDIDGDPRSVSAVNGLGASVANQIALASGALLTVNADGSFDYSTNGAFETLGVGEDAIDAFTYTIDDGNGGTDTATVTITINGVNDGPVAAADAIAVSEDAPSNGSLFADNGAGADNDVDGDALTVNAVNGSGANVGVQITLASGALLTVNADGSYDYDPNGQFAHLAVGEQALDSFNYAIDDGNGGTSTATVTFTINGVNDAPTAQDDAFSTAEGAALNGALLADNGAGADGDVEGNTLTVSAVDGLGAHVGTQITLASGALLTVNADGTFAYDQNGAFEHLGAGESDADTFSYTIDDGAGGSDTASVTITINGENDAPIAADDSVAVSENAPTNGNLSSDNGAGTDADADGDVLVITAVNGSGANIGTQIALASGALLTLNADGSYSYDPNGAFAYLHDGESAADSFSYTVDDGNGGTDTAIVSVTINGVNAAPLAADDAFLVDETAVIAAGDLFANNGAGSDGDGEGDTLVVSAVNGSGAAVGVQITLPSGALLTVNADGTFSYDPNGAHSPHYGQSAIDTFTYTIDDGFGGVDTATATITITNGGQIVSGATSGANTLTGTNGGDVISGLAGPDTLSGGAGGDQLTGGAGNDTLNGGDGDDLLDGVLDADTLNGGNGDDALYGRSGIDTLNGDAGHDTLYGGDGADILSGGDGDDLIDGLNHNDTAHGGEGDDVIYGRQNDDTLNGDAGHDTLYGGDGADALNGGEDNDLLDGGNNNDDLAGGEGVDVLYGRQGDDLLAGDDGHDTLYGGDGADDLSGGDGDDLLDGGNGVDRLDGGLGADTLIGGTGADTFVFSAALVGGNVDSIAIFNLADDRIELDIEIFSGIGLGVLDADAFVIGGAAVDAEDRIIYDAATGALYYDPDGSGAGAAVQFASLAPGLLGLTSDHFLGGGGP